MSYKWPDLPSGVTVFARKLRVAGLAAFGRKNRFREPAGGEGRKKGEDKWPPLSF